MLLIMGTATDKQGREVECAQIACPHCEGRTFRVFVIKNFHHHLECTECRESFCNGECNGTN